MIHRSKHAPKAPASEGIHFLVLCHPAVSTAHTVEEEKNSCCLLLSFAIFSADFVAVNFPPSPLREKNPDVLAGCPVCWVSVKRESNNTDRPSSPDQATQPCTTPFFLVSFFPLSIATDRCPTGDQGGSSNEGREARGDSHEVRGVHALQKPLKGSLKE